MSRMPKPRNRPCRICKKTSKAFQECPFCKEMQCPDCMAGMTFAKIVYMCEECRIIYKKTGKLPEVKPDAVPGP